MVEATSPKGERKIFKRTFRGDDSLKQARKNRDRIERKIETGEMWRELKLEEMKIGEYVLTTYLTRIRDRNSKDDANQKASAAKKYLPRFGDTSIVDLQPGEIEEWIYELEDAESKHGRPYSTETIKKYVHCFRSVITEMCNRFDVSNPFERVRVKPRHIRGRSRKEKVATKEELQALHRGLRERVEETRSQDSHRRWLEKREMVLHIFKVQVLTGCRSSELFYLEKEHLLVERQVLVVEGAVVRGDPGPTKAGKLANDRKKGIRRVPIGTTVVDVIQSWLQRRDELGFPDTNTIFTTQSGEYLRADNLREHYTKACRRVESTEITPHMLRHTLNDILRRQGTQRLARRALLGHSDDDVNIGYTNPRAEEAREDLENVVDLVELRTAEGESNGSNETNAASNGPMTGPDG